MKKRKPHATLRITFHNPNSEEETVRRLAKIVVEALMREGIPSEAYGKDEEKGKGAEAALL